MATPNVDTRKLLSEAKFYDGYSRFNDELERYEHGMRPLTES